MPKVHIINDELTLDVAEGEKMIDVCQRHVTSILFGCRNATCGSCLVNVKEGSENISAMEDREKALLKTMFAEPRDRLACQCEIKGDVTFEVPW